MVRLIPYILKPDRKKGNNTMTCEHCVYKHTSPSGKVYIGMTKQRPAIRWRNGLGYKGNEHFYKAICKYGWDGFKHEIIVSGLSYEDAANMEISLISSHNAVDRAFGYNFRYGGSRSAHSEETRRKMSIASMGQKGRSPSPEERLAISKALTGRKVSPETCAAISKALTGKKRSPEACANNSKAQTGKKLSEQTRLLMSKKQKERPMTESWERRLKDGLRGRPVEQLDLDGNVIARFNRMLDAANSFNVSRSAIWMVCKGHNITCKGYKWRYCE